MLMGLLLMAQLMVCSPTPSIRRALATTIHVFFASLRQRIPNFHEPPALFLQVLQHLRPIGLGKLLEARLHLGRDPLEVQLS